MSAPQEAGDGMDDVTRQLKQRIGDLALTSAMKQAIVKRWEAGREKFAGTADDCTAPGYDLVAAQEEELMDAVAYGAAAEVLGTATEAMRTRTAVAVGLLKAAVACHAGMATFATAGVSDKGEA